MVPSSDKPMKKKVDECSGKILQNMKGEMQPLDVSVDSE